ncbi:MAG: hypothetical protein Q8N96_06200 [Methylovulum sp.]|nr:hypothetical protein [Methylovulum sp.]
MFILNISRTCLVVVCVASISGCGVSAYTHRDTNPVVKDDTNNNNFWGNTLDSASFTTFSTTASRRIVVVLQDKNITQICSEPSPDVGEAFASAVADAISVKAPIEGVPVELSNQYARAVSTQIASLIYRTQGLQLYRDAMHNLCVDKMNKWITNTGETNPGSYEALRKHYFDQSLELIKAELASIKEVGTVKAGDNPDIAKVVDSTVKLLNAAKPAPASEAKPTPAATQ